jgi:threonyl-tRNA synthetase
MVRVELDRSSETMGKKVRTAIKQKIPHMLVIGEREMSTDTVTVRRYGSEEQQTIPFPQFKDQLMTTIRTRALDAARIF